MAKKSGPKKGKGPKLRVISVTNNGRTRQKKLSELPHEDQVYFTDLHRMLDDIFVEAAHSNEWTWNQLASHAGLAYQTVAKLGDRETRYPRFLTVYRLAKAIGWELVVNKTTSKISRKALKAG